MAIKDSHLEAMSDLRTRGMFTVSSCAEGINVLAAEESGYWDSVATRGSKLNEQALWRGHSDAVNAKLMERWLPKTRVSRLLKTDIFDEAFGTGLYPLFTLKAHRVVNIDVSASMLHSARTRYAGMQTVKADVRSLPFADQGFNAVVSNSTLDHFKSHDQIVESVRELSRTLAPGGELVITMDNPANPVVRLRNALPFRWLNRLGVLPYYVGATCNARCLKHHLQEAGLDALETTAILHCPRVLAVAVARYLQRRAGQRVTRAFLSLMMRFERLERWPTRYLTGYFVAVRAAKRSSRPLAAVETRFRS